MSTIAEIEAAIESLPISQVEDLARWLDSFRAHRSTSPAIENWLNRSRGAAIADVTTAQVMALTRDAE